MLYLRTQAIYTQTTYSQASQSNVGSTFLSRHWIYIALLCTSFLASVIAGAEQVPPNYPSTLSLKQAIAYTLERNPELKAMPFKTQTLEGEKQIASLRPPIHVGLDVENFSGSGELHGINALESTLTLGSVLELNHKRNIRINAIDSKIATLQLQQQARTLDILGALTIQFIQTLKTQESILITLEEQALAKKSLTIINNKAQRGAAADIDIQNARVTLARTNITLDRLQTEQQQQFRVLSQFWAERQPSYQRLVGELYSQPPQSDYEELLKRINRSPYAQQLALSSRVKDMQYQLALAQKQSDIDWTLGVKHLNTSGDTAIVAGISTTLNQGQRYQGKITAANAEKQYAAAEQARATLELSTQLFIAHSQRNHHVKAMTTVSRTIVPALSEALAMSQKAYESGRYGYLDWSMAQQALFKAKHRLLEHATIALTSQALIEQLTGEPLTP